MVYIRSDAISHVVKVTSKFYQSWVRIRLAQSSIYSHINDQVGKCVGLICLLGFRANICPSLSYGSFVRHAHSQL